MPARGCSSMRRSPAARQLEGGVDVADLVGDMVQAGTSLGQEAPDRGVRRERRQQLDVVLADVEQDGLDALLLDHLAVHDGHAEVLTEQRQGGVDRLHGNADVVDSPEHRPGSLAAPRGGAGRHGRVGAWRSAWASARPAWERRWSVRCATPACRAAGRRARSRRRRAGRCRPGDRVAARRRGCARWRHGRGPRGRAARRRARRARHGGPRRAAEPRGGPPRRAGVPRRGCAGTPADPAADSGTRPDCGGAHRVVGDHGVGDLGHALRSSEAPVVIEPNTSCSAARPPSRTVM